VTSFRVVEHGSPAWREIVELRRRILRLPLGLDFTEEQLEEERDQAQVGLYEDGRLVACALVYAGDAETAKVRQVAVEPTEQGKGYGRAVMDACEDVASEMGCRRIVLHARDTAVPFYLALGYEIEGEPFEEVTIPHRRMVKSLVP
jgi:predicted GNAT family N-acyltransferase